MKIPFFMLLAIVAAPAIASQNYRAQAHAWYNDEGKIEIGSTFMSSRTGTPDTSPGRVLSRAQTLPAAQLFRLNSAQLVAPSSSMQELARQLQHRAAPLTVVITGHTDSSGSAAHNLTLSTQRAQSIQRYLAGLAPQHYYRATGQGENSPAASNATRSGREQNRRVTVTIGGN